MRSHIKTLLIIRLLLGVTGPAFMIGVARYIKRQSFLSVSYCLGKCNNQIVICCVN